MKNNAVKKMIAAQYDVAENDIAVDFVSSVDTLKYEYNVTIYRENHREEFVMFIFTTPTEIRGAGA